MLHIDSKDGINTNLSRLLSYMKYDRY